jgi:hypothetical protein
MCERYARRSDKQRIAKLFAIQGPVLPDFGPSWNVAPQTSSRLSVSVVTPVSGRSP